MTILMLATVVGVLFASGTYLILQRRAVRLILGLGLLSHGVNLLLFSSSGLARGLPPIIDKKAFDPATIDQFVDPLPQALILTAIVISFGVTAFTVVLVNRRNALSQIIDPNNTDLPSTKAMDPFASGEHYASGLDQDIDDYEWLEYNMANEYRQRQARLNRQTKAADSSTDDTLEEDDDGYHEDWFHKEFNQPDLPDQPDQSDSSPERGGQA